MIGMWVIRVFPFFLFNVGVCASCLIYLFCGERAEDEILVFYKRTPSLEYRMREYMKGRSYKYTAGPGVPTVCAICLVDFKKKEKDLVMLDCSDKHIFHVKCIKKMSQFEHNSCPLCRLEIVE